jgi:hypothetical protein
MCRASCQHLLAAWRDEFRLVNICLMNNDVMCLRHHPYRGRQGGQFKLGHCPLPSRCRHSFFAKIFIDKNKIMIDTAYHDRSRGMDFI